MSVPPHIIYWTGRTYASLQSLVTTISSSEGDIFVPRANLSAPHMPGPMAVYFDGAPAIDLLPHVVPVIKHFAPLRPVTMRAPQYYMITDHEKRQYKAWKQALRADLRAVLEPLVPFPYA